MNWIEFVMMRRYKQLFEKNSREGLTSLENGELDELELSLVELEKREIHHQAGHPLRPPIAKGAH